MKTLAVLLILLGPGLAGGSVIYSIREGDRRQAIWLRMDRESMSTAQIGRSIEMLRHGLAPAWTVVDPWPGILAGLGCSAFGILLLAIVGGRPREEKQPINPFDAEEFRGRR